MERLDVFIRCFYGILDVFYERIDVFYERLDVFYERLDVIMRDWMSL